MGLITIHITNKIDNELIEKLMATFNDFNTTLQSINDSISKLQGNVGGLSADQENAVLSGLQTIATNLSALVASLTPPAQG